MAQLYYDILFRVFRMIWVERYHDFLRINRANDADSFTIMPNIFKQLPRVCRLWRDVCRDAGLIGPMLDFPCLKIYTAAGDYNYIINKYSVVITRAKAVASAHRRRIGVIFANAPTNLSICYREYNKSFRAAWTPTPKRELTTDQIVEICRQLGHAFGPKSDLARQLFHLGDNETIVPNAYANIMNGVDQWLAHINVCGQIEEDIGV
jgi:hypothetical protein